MKKMDVTTLILVNWSCKTKRFMVVERKYLSANNIKNLITLTLFFLLFSLSCYLINAP